MMLSEFPDLVDRVEGLIVERGVALQPGGNVPSIGGLLVPAN